MPADNLKPVDLFLLYVDRLQEGGREQISFVVDSTFLDVNDEELSYTGEVSVSGQAYLAGEELVLTLDIDALAVIPCAICNKLIEQAIVIRHFYHLVPLSEIRSGVYSFEEALREAVILESPRYIECGGSCPQRHELARYFKQDKTKEESGGDSTQFPFAHL